MSFQHRAPDSDVRKIKHEHSGGIDASTRHNKSNPWSLDGGHSKSGSPSRPDILGSMPSAVYRATPREQNSSVRRRQAVNMELDTEMISEPWRGCSTTRQNTLLQSHPNAEASWTGTWSTTNAQRLDSSHSIQVAEVTNKSETLRQLGVEMERLRQKHSDHISTAQRLEARVEKGETKCGQMIQMYLELGRAIQMNKQHVHEDKRALSDELSSRDDVMQRIHSIMDQMNVLMVEMQSGRTPQDAASVVTGPNSRA